MRFSTFLIVLGATLLGTCVYAQKTTTAKKSAPHKQVAPPKVTTQFNKPLAERVNPPYWGPGTYFNYAPGKSAVSRFKNDFGMLADMLGNESVYFYERIAELGHVRVNNQQNVNKLFQKRVKNGVYFLYSGANDTLLAFSTDQNIYAENQKSMVNSASKLWYIPVENKEEVVRTIWKYLNIVHRMSVSAPEIFPVLNQGMAKIDRNAAYPPGFGVGGWKAICMPYMKTVFPEGFGKPGYNGPKPHYDLYNYQDIIRTNLLAKGFVTNLEVHEADFSFKLTIQLEKEGYLCTLHALGKYMACLSPGNTWNEEYKRLQEEYKSVRNFDQTYDKAMNMIDASIRPKPLKLDEVLKYNVQL